MAMTGTDYCNEKGVVFVEEGTPIQNFLDAGVPPIVACYACSTTMAICNAFIVDRKFWCEGCCPEETK